MTELTISQLQARKQRLRVYVLRIEKESYKTNLKGFFLGLPYEHVQRLKTLRKRKRILLNHLKSL